MQPQPKVGTPEFSALKAEWDQKLAADGFDDIERPPTCREGADPSLPARHASRYRDYIRPDNPHARPLPLDDLLACEDSEAPPLLTRDPESLWSSRLDAIARALHRFEFRNGKDREIAQALYEGETWQAITQRLHVSHSRIARLQRQIREWARGR